MFITSDRAEHTMPSVQLLSFPEQDIIGMGLLNYIPVLLSIRYVSRNQRHSISIHSSECTDLEDSTGLPTPSAPVTPATPGSQLATSVSSVEISDSEPQTFAVPRPRRVYRKKRS